MPATAPHSARRPVWSSPPGRVSIMASVWLAGGLHAASDLWIELCSGPPADVIIPVVDLIPLRLGVAR